MVVPMLYSSQRASTFRVEAKGYLAHDDECTIAFCASKERSAPPGARETPRARLGLITSQKEFDTLGRHTGIGRRNN